MPKKIVLTPEQLSILERTVRLVFPGFTFVIDEDYIIRLRKVYPYDLENINLHWIEFIYKFYFPKVASVYYYSGQNFDKEYGLFNNSATYIFTIIERYEKWYADKYPQN